MWIPRIAKSGRRDTVRDIVINNMEIDIYPFWQYCAIVEVEISDENQQIIFPEYMRFIREVTKEAEYSNRAFAEKIHA